MRAEEKENKGKWSFQKKNEKEMRPGGDSKGTLRLIRFLKCFVFVAFMACFFFKSVSADGFVSSHVGSQCLRCLKFHVRNITMRFLAPGQWPFRVRVCIISGVN